MPRSPLIFALILTAFVITASGANAQVRGVDPSSAEGEARRQEYLKYLDRIRKKDIPTEPLVLGDAEFLPQLSVNLLKEGGKYTTEGGLGSLELGATVTCAKIVQIIDDNSMLVGIDNGQEKSGDPRYTVLVMCKVPTKGMTDGQAGYLTKFLGTKDVTVTGTTKYKTEGGGTRTVFVLEPYTRPKKADTPTAKPTQAAPDPPKKADTSAAKPTTAPDVSTLRDKVIGTRAVVEYVMEKEKVTTEERAFVYEYANYGLEKAVRLLKGLDEKKMAGFIAREEVQAWKEAEAAYQKALK
jgi:hypothetical protein